MHSPCTAAGVRAVRPARQKRQWTQMTTAGVAGDADAVLAGCVWGKDAIWTKCRRHVFRPTKRRSARRPNLIGQLWGACD